MTNPDFIADLRAQGERRRLTENLRSDLSAPSESKMASAAAVERARCARLAREFSRRLVSCEDDFDVPAAAVGSVVKALNELARRIEETQ